VGLWENAFDRPPNKYSATALELFLTKRCFKDHLSQSTGELIQELASPGMRVAAIQSSTCMMRRLKQSLVALREPVMDWSEAQCPGHWLSTNKQDESQFHDTRHLFNVARHGLMRAFLSTGFTLWTRYVCTAWMPVETSCAVS